jgi:hypothetical protein
MGICIWGNDIAFGKHDGWMPVGTTHNIEPSGKIDFEE